ncbi:hypothetical protein [Crocosphaera sp. Alani8]|uniref:hypothetical protein n=1 Tax=Crocosphaera sp. Alani8 TaxID=3038952 RepID=UPI00313BC11B
MNFKDFVNIKDISFFGLRRSGNHAIQNWIIRQNNSSFVHLNDVKLYSNKNPYKSFSKATISGINPLVYHKNIIKYKRYLRYLNNPKYEYKYGRNVLELDRERLRYYRTKSLIMHTYEHYSLSQVMGDWFENQRDKFLGKSKERFDILLLRDPFNLFASLIHRGEELNNTNYIIEKWLEHAREYYGITNYLKYRISINYNQWFINQDYRNKIAKSLNLAFTDAGINSVVNVGKGSSFDGTSYDGKASKMPVLYRYKDYLNHPVMLKVLSNEELMDFSHKIFGSIL